MRAVAISALLLVGAAPEPVRDWAGTLRTDARAFHDGIAANHAGPVDRRNPRFAALNAAGLRQALDRAALVKDYPGYLWAMRGYAARFDDGHVGVNTTDAAPTVTFAWPGFLTAYDAHGVAIVRTRSDTASVPLGAALQGCDGRDAETLGRTNVGAFVGRWFLKSQKINQGWRLFIDAGNPFVRRPATCTFRIDGKIRRVALAWQTLSAAERERRVDAVTSGNRAPIASRTLGDGTPWYVLSSFDGDPSSAAGKGLPGLIAGMAADRSGIAAAPRTVLDLRGNGGGSSDWSRQIAVILWGEPAVARAGASADYVEWRASAANVAFMRASLAERSTVAQSREVTDWFTRTIAGMAAALAAGRPLWREPAETAHAFIGTVSAPPALRGPVYFVTDPHCGSACLDAADLWKSLGAIQVGAETSADTFYMDIREDALPSGLLRTAIPMKVYRDRSRGSNVPLVPVHRFARDLRDTAALERWIASLPEDYR